MQNYREKKINRIQQKKDCAIKSLKEVEFFLHNLNTVCKSFKIYKILK